MSPAPTRTTSPTGLFGRPCAHATRAHAARAQAARYAGKGHRQANISRVRRLRSSCILIAGCNFRTRPAGAERGLWLRCVTKLPLYCSEPVSNGADSGTTCPPVSHCATKPRRGFQPSARDVLKRRATDVPSANARSARTTFTRPDHAVAVARVADLLSPCADPRGPHGPDSAGLLCRV